MAQRSRDSKCAASRSTPPCSISAAASARGWYAWSAARLTPATWPKRWQKTCRARARAATRPAERRASRGRAPKPRTPPPTPSGYSTRGRGWVSLAGEPTLPPAGRNLHVCTAADPVATLTRFAAHLTCIGTNTEALAAKLRKSFNGARVVALGDMQRPPLDGPRRPPPRHARRAFALSRQTLEARPLRAAARLGGDALRVSRRNAKVLRQVLEQLFFALGLLAVSVSEQRGVRQQELAIFRATGRRAARRP